MGFGVLVVGGVALLALAGLGLWLALRPGGHKAEGRGDEGE